MSLGKLTYFAVLEAEWNAMDLKWECVFDSFGPPIKVPSFGAFGDDCESIFNPGGGGGGGQPPIENPNQN